MDLKHFGDAYDIVKHSLLQWLAPYGPWVAHPMFTHQVSEGERVAFERLLGIPLVSTAVLDAATDRTTYLSPAGAGRSVFLDPDTGVRLDRREPKRSTEFIFADELETIVKARRDGLVLVFDQSVPRGGERARVEEKLRYFSGRGVSGCAYVSQACFLLLGISSDLVAGARSRILEESGLPESRVLLDTPPNTPLQPTSGMAAEAARG